jgi:single-stranded-DNA-specific exonuclease
MNLKSKKNNIFENYQNQRWSFQNYDNYQLENLMEHYSISKTCAKVLIHNMGTDNIEEIDSMLNPDESMLHEFNGFCDKQQIKQAADRIKKAQKNNELIVVNGDPDADGISGTVILVAALRQLGIRTEYLFPIRPVEGHGLQVRIINQAKQMGSSLIITTDCGTKDSQAVDYANKHGVDVIITDHHILGHDMPKSIATINPFTETSPSHYHSIAGASVSFKFVQAVYDYMNVEFPDYLFELSLIVSALGSISDRVSMKNPLNRLIVKKGVEYFFSTDREGMKALRDIAVYSDQTKKPRHLSRTVIPLLNAPGRIGNPLENIPDSSIVVDLLLLGKGKKNKSKATFVSKKLKQIFLMDDGKSKESDDDTKTIEAFQAANDVDSVNEKRKHLTAKIEDEMDLLIEKQVDPESDRIIILDGKDWNSGVIGIDADRLKERFLRPSIILNFSSSSDFVRGSARSIPRINIYKLIDQAEQESIKEKNKRLFEVDVEINGVKQKVNAFGGHSQACGFTIHKDNVELFKELLTKQAETLTLDQFEYHYDVIDELQIGQLSSQLIKQLDQFSPYGQKFEFPIFFMKNCVLKGGREFGNRYQKSAKQHVSFSVVDTNNKKHPKELDAVGFGLWEKFKYVRENSGRDSKIDLIFRLEMDPRAKKKRQVLRLNVLDIRLSE